MAPGAAVCNDLRQLDLRIASIVDGMPGAVHKGVSPTGGPRCEHVLIRPAYLRMRRPWRASLANGNDLRQLDLRHCIRACQGLCSKESNRTGRAGVRACALPVRVPAVTSPPAVGPRLQAGECTCSEGFPCTEHASAQGRAAALGARCAQPAGAYARQVASAPAATSADT